MMKNCSACERSGLPIVFVYHGAVANETPFASARSTPVGQPLAPVVDTGLFAPPPILDRHAASETWLGLPPIQHSRYVLRSLRPGMYLYIYHETPPALLKLRAAKAARRKKDADPEEAHWEVFRALPGGALVPREHPDFVTASPFSCNRDGGSHIFTTMTYRLPDAHLATGLRVAVSANLWSRKLRAKNKASMQRIDIQAVLAGQLPQIVRPDAQWLNQHVADFALGEKSRDGQKLGGIKHGGRDGTSPLAPVRGFGEALVKRMQQLSAGHPKTLGKGFVMPLRDPIGTAEALADISRARSLTAQDYAHLQRHPLGAAAGIEFVRKHVYDQHASQLDNRPLKPTDAYNAIGQPLFTPDVQKQLPPEKEMDQWVQCGSMRHETLVQAQRARSLPNSAKFLPYARMHGQGLVIAPKADVADLKGWHGTSKIRRLHDGRGMQTFLDNFKTRIEQFNHQISQHDADRSRVLEWSWLRAVMRDHYDSADPNTPQRDHTPGLVYMEEVTKALLSGADGVSPGLEMAAKSLMGAKLTDDEGWALRGMIANQEGLFSPLSDFWSQQFDWYNNPDNKLDKSYDTLKGLLCDEEIGGALKARFGWINQAGIGFSFSIQGFFAGAAAHFAFKAAAPTAAAIGQQASKAGKATQAAVVKTTQAGIDLLETAEAKFATKVNAWCHQQSLLLAAIVDKKPAPRPQLVRVEVTIEQALQILTSRRAASGNPNNAMGRREALWRALPPDARDAKVALDWITTDVDLKDVKTIADLDARASKVIVKVRDHHKGLVPVEYTLDELNELYRRAHRYDRLKNAAKRFVSDGIPTTAQALAMIAALPAKGMLGSIGNAVGPGGAIPKAGGVVRDAGATLGGPAAQLSLFGSWLQWRAHEQNEAKVKALTKRLTEAKGLTDEQKAALEQAILLTELGLWDNRAGIAGGLLEAGGLVAAKLTMTGTAAALMVGAALAGAVGNFANAMQNFAKAIGKWQSGDDVFGRAYFGVGLTYGLAATAFVGSGAEIAVHWFAERKLLEVGLRRTGAAAAARFGYGVVLRGLSLTGWGLVLTLAAFAIEGIVAYFDRTELEQWVEHCYFGNEPKYRGPSGRGNDPRMWNDEAKALEAAFKMLAVDAVTVEKASLPG